jgi:hypothetical protein
MQNLPGLPRCNFSVSKTPRAQRGNFLAEYPIVLLVLFIVLFVPMLNICSIGIRAYFVRSAVLEAAHSAGNAPSFVVNTDAPPSGESAVNRIDRIINSFKTGFTGIAIPNPAKIELLVQPLDPPGASPASNGDRVALPADPGPDQEKNQYFVQVTVNALVSPLLSYSGPFLPDVPGLSGPMPLTFSGRQLIESPDGFTQ